MWSRIALLSACACLALQPRMGAGEDSLEPAQAEPNLLARSSWVRLEIMGGRLAVLSQRCGQSRSVREEDPERAKQSLSVQLRGHALVVHYLFEDYLGRRELTVDEEGTVRVAAQRYESEPREVVLTQPASGKLKLRIVHGGDNDEFSATSLWHLMLSEPELFEHHAAPLLTSIRPDWRIAEQGAAIRESLLNAAGRDVLSERNQWKKWVEELSHPNFAKRQAADAALRAVGQPVIAWLGRLEANELDAEQRQRIRRICRDLADPSPDSPDRVVGWLIDDKTAWLSVIATGELDERIAAADHLSKLCRRPIPFDPHASHAERRTQMAELMARYSEN